MRRTIILVPLSVLLLFGCSSQDQDMTVSNTTSTIKTSSAITTDNITVKSCSHNEDGMFSADIDVTNPDSGNSPVSISLEAQTTLGYRVAYMNKDVTLKPGSNALTVQGPMEGPTDTIDRFQYDCKVISIHSA